jgi:hypothetical protein
MLLVNDRQRDLMDGESKDKLMDEAVSRHCT